MIFLILSFINCQKHSILLHTHRQLKIQDFSVSGETFLSLDKLDILLFSSSEHRTNLRLNQQLESTQIRKDIHSGWSEDKRENLFHVIFFSTSQKWHFSIFFFCSNIISASESIFTITITTCGYAKRYCCCKKQNCFFNESIKS
jgi:hypothetical protein